MMEINGPYPCKNTEGKHFLFIKKNQQVLVCKGLHSNERASIVMKCIVSHNDHKAKNLGQDCCKQKT